LNSLGDGTCRPVYRQALLDFLAARQDHLCDEHRAGLELNPLRVLDCKKPDCVAATADAPHQIDFLCEPCTLHFARVREGLDALGIPYAIDPRLVRGLDYYTRTTFEFASRALESAQNALGGGGRYDGLVEEMGGPPTPGIGFGIGLDRTLLACNAEGVFAAADLAPKLDVFVVDFADGSAARGITAALRAAGLRADRAFDGRSPKSQFKSADRSGARLALIIGPDEAATGRVKIKDLRAAPGTAEDMVPRASVVDEVRRRLSLSA
jgi:histidyl-tRNA synthetase